MNMNTLTNTIQGYYIPYGVFLPVQMYAWLETRHSKLYGVGADAMAAEALACRRHAQLNPRAFTYGLEHDAENYHSAHWIDRTRVVSGTRVSVRVEIWVGRFYQEKDCIRDAQ